MTPDLEEMIRRRAHEIWEQEGRPHGRHEDHWQKAAGEITQELERIKAAHTPATAEEIEAPAAPRRGRPRKAEVPTTGEESPTPRKRRASKATSEPSAALGETLAGSNETQPEAPRKRGRKAAGDTQVEPVPAGAASSGQRAAKGTTGAQSEPAASSAPKKRRKKDEAAEGSPEGTGEDRPTRRGRKPKTETDTIY